MNRTVANVELTVVQTFIAACIPFDDLSFDDVQALASVIQILYCREGERLGSDAPIFFSEGVVLVRSGGLDISTEPGKLIDRLAEGDTFSLKDKVEGFIVQAYEDSLLYYLPQESIDQLRNRYKYIDRFFNNQIHNRLQSADPQTVGPLIPVVDVMSSALISVNADASIQNAAILMSQHRVSSLLIIDGAASGRLRGIVTDRDIRSRAVAKGVDVTQPITSIMTTDLITLPASASLFDAVLVMTQQGIHHLPIVNGNRSYNSENTPLSSELVGILTASDIMLAREDDPVFIVQHLRRQTAVAGLVEVLKGLPNLLLQWQHAGMRAYQVSGILTAISDCVTQRLIELAIEQLGEAPVPFCWLGFGSQGRGEQLLGADQDNGIVIADTMKPEDARWFSQLAKSVCDGLDRCGYPYCPGDIMAVTDSWRQPLAGWQQTVSQWVRVPTPEAVLSVSIFFDIKAVYGDESLCHQLQQHMLSSVQGNQFFLAALAQSVVNSSPPLGLFRRFVVEQSGVHGDQLDIKKRGLLPIIETARIHALACGVSAVNTAERLDALVQKGALTKEDALNLSEAFKAVCQIRLLNQARQIERSDNQEDRQSATLTQLNNFLDPDSLSQLQRRQLKEAFAVVSDAQRSVRIRYLPLM